MNSVEMTLSFDQDVSCAIQSVSLLTAEDISPFLCIGGVNPAPGSNEIFCLGGVHQI